MVGDFLGAVVGHVADDHAVAAGRLEVDVVIAHPGADHALAPRCPGKAGLAQVGNVMKEHDRVGLGQVTGQLFLACRPAEHERRDVVEHGRLDRRFVKKIGNEHRVAAWSRHGRSLRNQKRNPSHVSVIFVARGRPPELGMRRQDRKDYPLGSRGCQGVASSINRKHGSGRWPRSF